jgi:long-chain fatty acid transport protein
MKSSGTHQPRRGMAALAVLITVTSPVSWAGNGFNLVGFGADSLGAGAADLSAAGTSAVVTNPSALTAIQGRALDLMLDPFHLLDTGHRDTLGNRRQADNKAGAFAGAGYAQRINDRFVAGTALLVQGGAGFVYEDLDSGFGTRGDISSMFSVFKLATGFGWELQPGLSVGVSLGLSYATARQKYFIDSSVFDAEDPQASLFGTRIDSLRGHGINGVLGLRYQLTPEVTLALAYRSDTTLDLDGGTLTVNYEALDQGRVVYRNTALEGLAIAQDLNLGVTVQPSPQLRLMAKFGWIDWSRAGRDVRLQASVPSHGDPQLVPASIDNISPLQLRDQYTLSLGGELALGAGSRLRAGYNYGRNPVPGRNLTPLLALIPRHHYMLGYGRSLSPEWDFDIAVQYQPRSQVEYSNPSSPLTEQAAERNHAMYLHLMLRRRW